MSFRPGKEEMNRACDTAHDYMLRARRDIDNNFGEGYAHKHPDLVGQYMRVACADFIGYEVFDYYEGHLTSSLNEIADSILKLSKK